MRNIYLGGLNSIIENVDTLLLRDIVCCAHANYIAKITSLSDTFDN